jgi:hypothetical protein
MLPKCCTILIVGDKELLLPVLEGIMAWENVAALQPQTYDCGYCGYHVSSVQGFRFATAANRRSQEVGSQIIAICPNCWRPTVFTAVRQIPGVRPGQPVQNLPKDIQAAYDEARDCVAAGAFTAAAMLARKLLMHIAVAQGAQPGLTFKGYVDHLANNGYVPPNGRGWVDHIRDKGNEANHELVFVNASDAGEILGFIEMLLKFIYEFPARIGAKQPAPQAKP